MTRRRYYQSSKKSYSEDVLLITTKTEENDIGEMVIVGEVERLVFAREVGVSRTEVYQSRVAGLKPSLALEMKSIEYQGEEELEFNGQRYHIIKQYPQGQDIELTCEKVVYENS